MTTLPNRSECRGGCRPCPLVRCRHHLLITHTTRNPPIAKRDHWAIVGYNSILSERYGLTNAMIEAFPLVALHALPETCSLDVADRGEHTLDELTEFMGITREAVRQTEQRVQSRLRDGPRGPMLRALLDMANERNAGQHEPAPKPLQIMAAGHGEQSVIVSFQRPDEKSWAHRVRKGNR